jgi:hypothetical protein
MIDTDVRVFLSPSVLGQVFTAFPVIGGGAGYIVLQVEDLVVRPAIFGNVGQEVGVIVMTVANSIRRALLCAPCDERAPGRVNIPE